MQNLTGVESETDDLPLTESERSVCAQDYLLKIDQEIEGYLDSQLKGIIQDLQKILAFLKKEMAKDKPTP